MLCITASDLGNRDGLLRAVLHAGQAIDALGHVRRVGLAALQFEDGLGTDIHAIAVSVALFCINRYHVHNARASSC